MHEHFPLPDASFAPLRPFWDAAAAERLVMPYSARHGRIAWYPDDANDRYDWREVSGRGSLYSWAVVTHAFLPQYRDLLPFATGLVALEEDPSVRLVSLIVDCDPAQLAVDQPLEVVFRPLRFAGVDGERMAPHFKPAG